MALDPHKIHMLKVLIYLCISLSNPPVSLSSPGTIDAANLKRLGFCSPDSVRYGVLALHMNPLADCSFETG